MSKIVLLTICLLVSSAFARHDFPRYHYGHKATVGDNADLIAFTKGFLKGVGEDSVFDQVKACLGDGTQFYKQVSTAIADIKTKNPAKVKEGIILLGQAVQLLPQAARDCKAAEADIAKLIKLARAFTNPIAFAYTVGKSLLINHVEIIHEITSAVSAYEAHDYFTLGYWVGKAMDTIFLGLNRKINAGLVEHINNNNFGWKAGISPKFANMTLAEIKAQFLGAVVPEGKIDNVPVYEPTSNDIPTYFNASEKWPGCIHPIRDQGHCGSCWAFAASEVLTDRFCIASKKEVDVVLSPQYMVSCDTNNYGCNGGYPILSWYFLASNGLVTESCWPYESGSGVAPKCSAFTACHDGAPIKKYKTPRASIVQFTNTKSLQENIMQYGPVEAAFSVYEDFIHYTGGIYKHTSGSLLGGHAVKIIGWGREGSTDYWIVANSWNTTWGEKGFFRIAFGQCGIDRACLAGQADLSSTQQFLWQ